MILQLPKQKRLFPLEVQVDYILNVSFPERRHCFVSECINQQFQGTTPLKFNSSPLKNGGKGRRSFPFGVLVPFQGKTHWEKLREKNSFNGRLHVLTTFRKPSDSSVLSTLVEAVLVLSASLELQKHPERSEVLGRKFNPKKSGKRRANIEGFPWQPLGPLLKVKL